MPPERASARVGRAPHRGTPVGAPILYVVSPFWLIVQAGIVICILISAVIALTKLF